MLRICFDVNNPSTKSQSSRFNQTNQRHHNVANTRPSVSAEWQLLVTMPTVQSMTFGEGGIAHNIQCRLLLLDYIFSALSLVVLFTNKYFTFPHFISYIPDFVWQVCVCPRNLCPRTVVGRCPGGTSHVGLLTGVCLSGDICQRLFVRSGGGGVFGQPTLSLV